MIGGSEESGNANIETVENTSLIFHFAASYRIGSIGKNNRRAEAYKNLRLIVENCGARRGTSVSDGNYIGVTLLNWLSLILYWNERARWTTAHVPTITPARLDMHTKQLYEITHRVDNDGFFSVLKRNSTLISSRTYLDTRSSSLNQVSRMVWSCGSLATRLLDVKTVKYIFR